MVHCNKTVVVLLHIPHKTFFINFINKNIGNSDIQIKIKKKNITTANEIKFLGLIIDNKLSWKGHIDYITPN